MQASMMAEQEKALEIESAAFTDPGSERDLNQDVVFHQTSFTGQGEPVGLFLVCDGVGGHRGGEIASRIAVDTITSDLAELFSSQDNQSQPASPIWPHRVEAAIRHANDEIRQYAQKYADKTPDLGTTVTLAVVFNQNAFFAHVGDCRAYLWRKGGVSQITQDHSVAAQLAREGIIDEIEIAQHPSSNVILRALGKEIDLNVDVSDQTLEPGDKLLLCSDGLWKSLSDPIELARWMGKPLTAADLCQQLVAKAKTLDGSDNISAIVANLNEAVGC